MGISISKVFTPVKNYFSDFWMEIFGFGPRMQGTFKMAAPPVVMKYDESDDEEAEPPVMIYDDSDYEEEAPPKSSAKVHEVPDEMKCTHCRGTGIKKTPTGSPAAAKKPQHKTKPKKQGPTGYAGKPEFYIEGFDKMTPDQKRAAKQAKWNEVQAARAAKGQKPLEIAGSGFEDCIVTTNWGDGIHSGQ
jgi:hypothetical protein